MVKTDTAWEHLRAEYDPAVLDGTQRAHHAQRLHAALCAAGLWHAGARLLDVGCGSGLLLAALGDDARQRIGCDVRRTLYMQARRQATGVLFTQADGMQLPFPDGYFHFVMCRAMIEELPDWRVGLSEMARCVAPGGILYLTVTHSQLLLPLYRLAELLGCTIRHNRWAYARSSRGLSNLRPREGFGIPSLAAWHYVHITPYLARSQWPWLRLLPGPVLDWLMRQCAPSFGHAWQRPA